MDRLSSVVHGVTLGVERSVPLEVHLRNAYYRTLNRLVREAAANFSRRAPTHLNASAQESPTPAQAKHLETLAGTEKGDVPRATAEALQRHGWATIDPGQHGITPVTARITDAGRQLMAADVPSVRALWQMPHRDEVLPEGQAKDALTSATKPIRQKIVSHMMGGGVAAVGLSFDVTNPLAQHVLSTLGTRITEITELTRTEIMRSLSDSHAKGLSIPHAARAMSKDVRATNISRSTLIARTEFIGAQNGSSLAAVKLSGAGQMKTWLATNDNRTRADHADADGQTVPLDGMFDVGGNPMLYPGDQNAPADEVCNCRCTLTYT